MSRSCVCGGENENCRYCGGSGIVADRLGAALDDTLRRVAVENSPTEDIKAAPKRRSAQSNINLPPPIRWIKCPKGCGRWVNPQKVERHLKNCTGVRVAAPQKVKTAPTTDLNPKQEERQYELCPLCGAKLKKGRMQRHLSKAHRTTTSNPLFSEAVRRANLSQQQKAEKTVQVRQLSHKNRGPNMRRPNIK